MNKRSPNFIQQVNRQEKRLLEQGISWQEYEDVQKYLSQLSNIELERYMNGEEVTPVGEENWDRQVDAVLQEGEENIRREYMMTHGDVDPYGVQTSTPEPSLPDNLPDNLPTSALGWATYHPLTPEQSSTPVPSSTPSSTLPDNLPTSAGIALQEHLGFLQHMQHMQQNAN
jgi:hypothetical protein